MTSWAKAGEIMTSKMIRPHNFFILLLLAVLGFMILCSLDLRYALLTELGCGERSNRVKTGAADGV